VLYLILEMRVFVERFKKFNFLFLASLGLLCFVAVFLMRDTFAENGAIELAEARIVSSSNGVIGEVTSINGSRINTNIEMHALNDEVDFEVKLKNTSKKSLRIDSIEDNNNNPNIAYYYDNLSGRMLASGEDIAFAIKAKYENPVESLDLRVQILSVDFSLNFTYLEDEESNTVPGGSDGGGDEGESVTVGDMDNEVSGEDDARDVSIDAPTTLDTVLFAFCGFAASMLCLVALVLVLKKKNKVAGGLMVLVTGLTAMALSPLASATDGGSGEYVFGFDSDFALMDKIAVSLDGETVIVGYGTRFSDIDETNATEIEGYRFSGWKDENDAIVSLDARITQDSSFVSVYEPIVPEKYMVAITAANATLSQASFSLEEGESAAFSLTPKTGYYVSEASCSEGYSLSGLTTGTSARSAQSLTVVNNIASDGECVVTMTKLSLLYDVASVGQYIYYTPSATSVSLDSNYAVYGSLNPSATKSWRVLAKNSDGTIDIIPATTAGSLTWGKDDDNANTANNKAYSYYSASQAAIANAFEDGNFASSTRAVSENDFETIKNAGLTISASYVADMKSDTANSGAIIGNQSGSTYRYYIGYANQSEIKYVESFYVYGGTGGSSRSSTANTLGVRPIIRLKAGIYKDAGVGSSGSPWTMTF